MPFFLVQGDIVHMETDAIVNAANSALAPGGGVCGAIFRAAGYGPLERACRSIGGCATGEAVVTEGFRLPAKYIIHTVGPIWRGGGQNEAALLRSCYLRSLALARSKGCGSVAFPLISAGIYGYPRQQALQIAVSAIGDFLQERDMTVYLVLFGGMEADPARFAPLQAYLDRHYHPPVKQSPMGRTAGKRRSAEPELCCAPAMESADSAMASAVPARRLEDVVSHLDDSFSTLLFRLIDDRGLTDTQVYRRANLDRKLFSKLRRQDYRPGKATVLALCLALRLSMDESRDLLSRAGYALSPSRLEDVIVAYFIEEGRYDIGEVNEALFAFHQKLLGAV